MMKKYVSATLALAAAALPAPSMAAVFLDTISCSVTGGGTFSCSPETSIVNPAARFSEEFYVGPFTQETATLPSVPETNAVFVPPAMSVDFRPVGLDGAFLTVRALGSYNLFATILNFENLTGYWTNFTFHGKTEDSFIPIDSRFDGLTSSDVTLRNGVLSIDLRGSRIDRTVGRFSDNSEFYISLTEGARPAVPEPSSWAMMILGFGTIGTMLRRRRAHRSIAAIASRI